jgi:hypothetical protein
MVFSFCDPIVSQGIQVRAPDLQAGRYPRQSVIVADRGESAIFIRFHCSPIQFTEGDNFRVVIQSIRREHVPWLCDLHLQKGRESSEHSTQAPIEKTSFHEQLLKQACYLVLRHRPFRFRGSSPLQIDDRPDEELWNL